MQGASECRVNRITIAFTRIICSAPRRKFPVMRCVIYPRKSVVLIRAINSQRRLKPYFYSQSAKVGGVGCLFGFAVAYPLFFFIASSFGIESDIPIRSYDADTVLAVFTLCFLILCLSLYTFCALFAFIYYGIKCKKGYIDREELVNIVFKGIYPKRWQRGL